MMRMKGLIVNTWLILSCVKFIKLGFVLWLSALFFSSSVCLFVCLAFSLFDGLSEFVCLSLQVDCPSLSVLWSSCCDRHSHSDVTVFNCSVNVVFISL